MALSVTTFGDNGTAGVERIISAHILSSFVYRMRVRCM